MGELTGGAGCQRLKGKGGAVVSSGTRDLGQPRKEGGRGEAGGRRWAGPRPEIRRRGGRGNWAGAVERAENQGREGEEKNNSFPFSNNFPNPFSIRF